MKNVSYLFAALVVLACGSSDQEITTDSAPETETSLPFHRIDLSTLGDFEEQKGNWQLAAAITSDPNKEHDLILSEGEGLLANLPTEDKNSNLTTNWEHGDLELKFDVLVPKGSNSGVYFQGRYEIQILDSWGRSNVGSGDMGGIYDRWDEDRPEGSQGYDGAPPVSNASKAPGLWQTCHVLFKAPRFDAQGVKTNNAQFEWVYLNGHQIHRNVDLSGPTRGAAFEDESNAGPLYIQGDHGPVAFRNISYKRFGQDTLLLQDLTYDYFEGSWDYIPGFDSLAKVKSGDVAFIDLESARGRPAHYALIFRGDLVVPISGDYIFETRIDDGGDLLIDSALVVHNEGEPGMGSEFGKVHLGAGRHDLVLTYYQEVWSAVAQIYYEGPEIERRSLASFVKPTNWEKQMAAGARVLLDSLEQPTLLRGFVNHGDDKLTHSISVGHPDGIHFAYDLFDGTIVKGWKGGFTDVTNMWRNRGSSQLALPLNAALEFDRGIRVARLSHEEASWPTYRPDDFKYNGYRIDQAQMPTFMYQVHGMTVEDQIEPIDNGSKLRRQIEFKGAGQKEGLYYKLDEASSITVLENGMYNVGGKYFVLSDQELTIRELENQDELVVALNGRENISYDILW